MKFNPNFRNSQQGKIKNQQDVKRIQESIKDFGNKIDIGLFEGLNAEEFKKLAADRLAGSKDCTVFWENIDLIGADTVFLSLDKNGDGILDKKELFELSGQDKDKKTISNEDFKDFFNNNILKTIKDLLGNQGFNLNGISSGRNVISPDGRSVTRVFDTNSVSDVSTDPTVVRKERERSVDKPNVPDSVAELEAEKQDVIKDAAAETKKKNDELNKAIQDDKNISDELKTSHDDLTKQLNDINGAIKDSDVQISQFENSIHSKDCEITSMEAELGAIKTDTDDEELNLKNEGRKAEVSKSLDAAKAEKIELEGQLTEAKAAKEKQLTQKTEIENNIAAVREEIEKNASSATKTLIQELPGKIAKIEDDKQIAIGKIDEKIEQLKAKELSNAERMGEIKGEDGELAQLLIEIGSSQEMKDKFYGRETAWCGAFVNEVLRLAYEEMGLGNPRDYKLREGRINIRKMTPEQKEEFFATQLRPGMVFEYDIPGKENSYHTGFIMEVLPDGSFMTLEGNTWTDEEGAGVIGSHQRTLDYEKLHYIYPTNVGFDNQG